MKYIAFALLFALVSCTDSTNKEKESLKIKVSNEITMLNFISLIDSAEVDGSVLVSHRDKFYSNDFEWALKQHIPASTFKIPNSIIALELEVMEDDNTMIPWDGEPRFMKRWEQDLNFHDAFHTSCVPCYQEIARTIGVDRMKAYTDKLNFGTSKIDSSNIDMFWLDGSSKISQFEEIDFLKRFREKKLPISDRTHEIMNRMMIIEETDEYTLRGKTGWSVQDSVNNCWFVGYVELDDEVYYFATNIEPDPDADISKIVSLRKEITRKALGQLGVPISVE